MTRRDLPSNHLTVQAIHAAIAATFVYGEPTKTHPHLVVCAVNNEQELATAFERLKSNGVQVCAYHEDDMGNAMTAIATAPLSGVARRPLRRFKLL